MLFCSYALESALLLATNSNAHFNDSKELALSNTAKSPILPAPPTLFRPLANDAVDPAVSAYSSSSQFPPAVQGRTLLLQFPFLPPFPGYRNKTFSFRSRSFCPPHYAMIDLQAAEFPGFVVVSEAKSVSE